MGVKRRILLGWEFGAGNGHAVILREIARHFPSESYELRFAMRFPATATGRGIDQRLVIDAPSDRPLAKPAARSTYGEFVCEALMGAGQDFASRLAHWGNITAAFKPDAIVAEYAPSLGLYARGRIPVVATGSGYSLPPARMPEFPQLTKRSLPRFATEGELVDRLNGHLRKAGAATIERLPQLNAADAYGLMTLPLFDPYAEYRDCDYLGTCNPGGSPVPGEGATGFIAYFDESWQFNDAFLDGLRNANVSGRAFLGMPLRRTSKRMAGSAVMLAEGPFHLAREMPGKGVAIHMGTLGFASAAACAGVPQLVLPKNQENTLIARALEGAGVAINLPARQITAEVIAEKIRHGANDSQMRAAALRLAAELTPFRGRDPAKAVADTVRALIT